MTFFEEYKRLERICNDMYSCKSGVSEYIAEMERSAERGRAAVPGWDAEYKTLKHLRWLRNQIAHSADGDGFCKQDDLTRLRRFHENLLSQKDPIAVLHRAVSKSARKAGGATPQKPAARDRKGGKHPAAVGLLIFLVLALLAGLGLLYLRVSGR